jgi:ribose transport system ATP-binding protein
LDAKVLIFDEPTSSLSEHETNALFQAIRKLKKKDIGIIYISHRLEEVFQICDCLTIMRDGSVVAEKNITEVNSESIIRMMIGRDIKEMYHKEKLKMGKQILEVRNLNVKGILKDVSFTVNGGEIVGIAGLVGAGRTEMVRAIFGDLTKSSGQILIEGKPIKINSPADGIKAGIGLVPEDRKEQGLVLGMPVSNNISMAIFSKIASFGILNRGKEKHFADSYVKQLSIRTPSIDQPVQYLSGGNQQRVVIAKWLATNPKLLLVDEPTRGIDVGAKAAIHALLSELAQKGVAILMISSELPEILAMSDRILVMHQGKLKAELAGKKTTEEEVMRYAIGQASA